MRRTIAIVVAVLLGGCAAPTGTTESPHRPVITRTTPGHTTPVKPKAVPKHKVVLVFHLSRYPNIADHVRDAQAAGESKVCTIDRRHATQHRRESLANEPAPPAGMDRDEYPPAMCKEGGSGADVRPVPSKENRSAGAWMGNKLESYPNGTVVLFRVAQ